jgi:hypothetical protein
MLATQHDDVAPVVQHDVSAQHPRAPFATQQRQRCDTEHRERLAGIGDRDPHFFGRVDGHLQTIDRIQIVAVHRAQFLHVGIPQVLRNVAHRGRRRPDQSHLTHPARPQRSST